ncbi:MAG: ureidoglycolate lyase [Granulosicoccus sp.]
MTEILKVQPLTLSKFESFGEIIETQPTPTMMINEGRCARHHDLAKLKFQDARAGISVFQAQLCSIPYHLRMMERHPLGSQTFLPLNEHPFLIIVAEDHDGVPHNPQAFLTNGRQGVNYRCNTWHGVLTPLSGSGLFTVVDRIGEGNNLQEHWFDDAYQVIR